MAGAGYKLFNTGDVLTAAQVNTYLQEQAVMRFANAAARTTALSGVLAEGMVSYLDDTNAVQVYNGSAWVNVGEAGDITAVTAGTGLTGGGTSGAVTLNFDVANFGGGTFAAGKNRIINGDFNINQRNFTSSTGDYLYHFDRFGFYRVGGSATISAQTFTPGTAPVVGYEARNFFRCAATGSSGSFDRSQLYQLIEGVRTFAGQTVTISFWAKALSGTPKLGLGIEQVFGTGGSAGVAAPGNTFTLSTSWVRYSATVAIPSISGKTVGTANDHLAINFIYTAGSGLDAFYGTTVGVQTTTIDIWGVQVEAGNVATAFQTATGTLAGELAACQRYYYRNATTTNGFGRLSAGIALSGTVVTAATTLPVTMRVQPTSIDFANLRVNDSVNATAVTSLVVNSDFSQANVCGLTATVSSGLTQYRPYFIEQNSSTTGHIGFSAEL